MCENIGWKFNKSVEGNTMQKTLTGACFVTGAGAEEIVDMPDRGESTG